MVNKVKYGFFGKSAFVNRVKTTDKFCLLKLKYSAIALISP